MAVSSEMITRQEAAAREIDRLHHELARVNDPGIARGLARQLLNAVRRLPGCSTATRVRLPVYVAELVPHLAA